ncbi:hypothetical protein O181_023031 [Austropuccinia psidii MF-1]|uniref:Integrase catalytic domain-containing protein n=1 Tax=Austropuccinia psidii MF-1 TaxID=1389203 RepID=A0A9Q3CE23_9BASI|nr:hypothetical protein [Austropuccinia psidii MF-1]
MGKLWKHGFLIKKLPNDQFSIRQGDFTLMDGYVKENMFHLNLSLTKVHQSFLSKISECTLHNRAGHPNNVVLKHMFPQVKNPPFFEACAIGKSHQLPYKGKLRKAPYAGHTVYSDLSGKISPLTIGGGQYYLKFTNDFSNFKIVYILKNKSETCQAIKNYINQIKTTQNKPVRVMVNDNGGEYVSRDVQEFIDKEEIRMEFTAPYSPQQNSVSERENRSTLEKAQSLLFNCKLPASFWGEAIVTSVFLKNITPSLPAHTKTPFEIWYGKPFDLSRLQSFGCLCFVDIPKVKRHGKFSPTATKGIFLGYDNYKHNYRVMLPNGKITYSHDTKTISQKPHLSTKTAVPSIVNEEAIVQQSSLSAPWQPGWDILLTSNTAPKNVSSNLDQANILEGKRRRAKMTIINHLSKNPKSWNDAMRQPDKKEWVNALNNKLHNLTSRGVIKTVPLPSGKWAIGFSVQFKRKFYSDNNLVKKKVRICAQGFSQQPGVDYDNTFSPTGKSSSLRALLSISSNRKLEVHHMDTVAAFLNPSLNEEIYMKIPTFIKRTNENEVWKLC